jgi:hypothetical protein
MDVEQGGYRWGLKRKQLAKEQGVSKKAGI